MPAVVFWGNFSFVSFFFLSTEIMKDEHLLFWEREAPFDLAFSRRHFSFRKTEKNDPCRLCEINMSPRFWEYHKKVGVTKLVIIKKITVKNKNVVLVL